MQLDCPVEDWYWPAGQLGQLAAPAPEKRPAGHASGHEVCAVEGW